MIEGLSSAERAALLNSKEPMERKWRAAWNLLDEDKGAHPIDRAAACCWLIYRGIEGHIDHKEMLSRVLPVAKNDLPPKHEMAVRWRTSLSAAAYFYFYLHDMEKEANIASHGIIFTRFWAKNHPPALTNYLRVQLVRIYDAFVKGNHDKARRDLEDTVNRWQSIFLLVDHKKYPLIFMDGKGDMIALHALMCISGRLGMAPEWMKHHEEAIQCLNDPCVKCLKKHGGKPGAIWS